MKLKFSTKAQNLRSLEGKLKSASVLPQVSFKISDWKKSPDKILKQLDSSGFSKKKLILRSSAKNEDSSESSMAGYYDSISNIFGKESAKNAGDKLAKSKKLKPNDELFFQPQVENPKLFGVAFSRNPNNDSPYIVVNYDNSGSTSDITSGRSIDHKTAYVHRNYKNIRDKNLKQISALVFELEKIFSCEKIDIEFAIDEKDKLHLFQVRPLNIKVKAELSDKEHFDSVKRISQKIDSHSKENPFNLGKKNVYGNMPDWNPAEIVGTRPRQLALSLYREVVTDTIWAYQRDNYGYRNLRSHPLIIEFEGMPYIDTRVSFNSFIPKSLDSDIADKLANFYIEKLTKNNRLHDKIEFEIAYTCYDFSTDKKLRELKSKGFSSTEIEKISTSLKSLTNNIINAENGLWQKDREKIKLLEARHKKLVNSDLDHISKLYWLIEDCKRYGTLPFAGLARAGFIAISFLKSFVSEGIFTQSEYYAFLNTLDTISANISRDFSELSKNEFLAKYGHLRPGTYDITSKRYDEAPDLYFDWKSKKNGHSNDSEKFSISVNKLRMVENLLREKGISIDALNLLEFIKEAIEAREHSKFVFTKSLSDFLKILTEYSAKLGISVDDIGFANVKDVLSLYSSSYSPEQILKNSIAGGKDKYKHSQMICLPSLLWSGEQAFCFEENESTPNFITNRDITAEVELISQIKNKARSINKKVVAIVNADPGYDWVFSHNIAGLITKYGGANSHMAIRAAELGIPAVIGVGSKFDDISKSGVISINCSAKTILKVS
jgi:phosphoenolpyruvate synthase/pyruvate phosphate dikinase